MTYLSKFCSFENLNQVSVSKISIFVCIYFFVEVTVSVASESAALDWAAYSDFDASQFKEYIVTLMYSDDSGVPAYRTMSSLTNSYEITNLDAESQYSVWVNVDTVDYGQSELNDGAIFSTIASSASGLSIFETLEALYVRLVLGSSFSVLNVKFVNSQNSTQEMRT